MIAPLTPATNASMASTVTVRSGNTASNKALQEGTCDETQ